MRIGYDFDGVICQRLKWDDDVGNEIWSRPKVKWRPEGFEDSVVITARPPSDAKVTEAWLAKHDLRPKRIYYTGLLDWDGKLIRELVIPRKAEVINALNLDRYYEDMPEIVAGLRTLCPEVDVVRVEHTEEDFV